MKNTYMLPTILGCAIIGASLVAGALLLSSSEPAGAGTASTAAASASEGKTGSQEPIMLNMKEAAAFLHMSEEELTYMIQSETRTLLRGGEFMGEVLPYIKVKDALYFNLASLLEWSSKASKERRIYENGEVSR